MTDFLDIIRQEKLEEIELLEAKKELEPLLPHLYGFPFYKWSREFFESRNFFNFLCAGNQISKSSTEIRKAIHWATCPKIWGELWRTKPNSFWYLYPSKEVATVEFMTKWETEFLPRGKMKDDPIYGWEEEYKNRWLWALHFNSGVSIFFRSYAQEPDVLQAGSPYAIFCDEELPFLLMPELSKRLLATDGYFHMVFTATLGQEEWRQTMEEKGAKERYKGAAKWQISMRKDCLTYEDGSPSIWTPERIARAIATCQSEVEVGQRIDGKFVVAEGLTFDSFEESRNVKPGHYLPARWKIYCGVDIGSGGSDNPTQQHQNHPAAITFVGVSPDYKHLRVFKHWRGDDEETANSDILKKMSEMRGEMEVEVISYDWASRDFFIIGSRAGENLQPADKGRERGIAILNTLFKNGMLVVYDTPDNVPLIQELKTLKKGTPKNKAKDDSIDSLRYAIMPIPINWEGIILEKELQPKKEEEKKVAIDRWGQPLHPTEEDKQLGVNCVEDEIEEWNAAYEL